MKTTKSVKQEKTYGDFLVEVALCYQEVLESRKRKIQQKEIAEDTNITIIFKNGEKRLVKISSIELSESSSPMFFLNYKTDGDKEVSETSSLFEISSIIF